MRILKTKRFAKLATDEGLTDEALKDAIKKAIDAKALIEVKRDGDNKKGSKKDSDKESGDGGS